MDSELQDGLAIMLDEAAPFDDRWDIVVRLRRDASHWVAPPTWLTDEAVLDALTALAGRVREEPQLQLEAAEALAQIWLFKRWIDRERYVRLAAPAQAEVRSYLELNNPALLDGVA